MFLKTIARVSNLILLVPVTLLLLFCGCRDTSPAPELHVRAFSVWAMPPEGTVLPAPRAVATGKGDEALVLDTIGRVIVFGPDGRAGRRWFMPETKVGRPEDVCLLRDGRIAVADTHYHRIVFFSQAGELLGMLGRHGTGTGEFIYPVAIVQGPDGSIYVAEYGSNDRVQKFTPRGDCILAFGSFGTEPGQFQRPSGIAWHDGCLYVADAINNRVQAFTEKGEFRGILGEGVLDLRFPYDIAAAPDGTLFVVEYGSGRVTRIDTTGRLLGRYGSTGAGSGHFVTPWGIAVDSRTRIRVADTGNRRMVELTL